VKIDLMIELKPLKEQDVQYFYSWINDDEVIKYSLSVFQNMETKEEVDSWFKKLLDNRDDLQLGIYDKSSKKLIGYAGISNISKLNKSGEYFIFIGGKTQWGKGISTEVTKQILEVGFNKLGLNRIMLTVSEPNIGGVKSYLKVGFKQEGILRKASFRDGQFHNKIVMSVLKSEWNSKV
jgi:RimJ/RimL family protein N-acetyltransferase